MESSAKKEERNIKRREKKQREKIKGEISNPVIIGFRGNNSLDQGRERSIERPTVSSVSGICFSFVPVTNRNLVQN